MFFRCFVGFAASGALLLTAACRPATKSIQVVRGQIPADWPADTPTPVVVPLAGRPAGAALQGQLTIEGQDKPIDVTLQWEAKDAAADTPARAWFMLAARPADRGKRVSLRITGPTADAKAAFEAEHKDPLVNVRTADGKPVLSYRHGRPDPVVKYPMTSYIHPMFGLDGELITQNSPQDHLHHRGLFWAWVRIERDGQNIGDWWIPEHITMEPAELDVTTGPVFARFAARHYWLYQPSPDAKAERIVDEHVVCRVYPAGKTGRAIDLDLTLTALQDKLRIGGQTQGNKGYGGVTWRLRGPGEGGTTDVRIVADGKPVEADTVNHLKARWVDWTGVFLGPDSKPMPGRSGGAMLVDPSHPPLPAEPPEWITRAYGPINVAYPGLEMLDLPRGKPLHLRYRLWIHRGDAETGGVDGQYRALAADWGWTAD